jgi:hypothetical protein
MRDLDFTNHLGEIYLGLVVDSVDDVGDVTECWKVGFTE